MPAWMMTARKRQRAVIAGSHASFAHAITPPLFTLAVLASAGCRHRRTRWRSVALSLRSMGGDLVFQERTDQRRGRVTLTSNPLLHGAPWITQFSHGWEREALNEKATLSSHEVTVKRNSAGV